MTARRLSLASVTLLLAASLIDAPYPVPQRLQHLPTVPCLIALGLFVHRVSAGTFYGLLGFFVLHIVGARWIYSLVPYDDWMAAAFGVRPTDHFDWRRNHYDRFVHLAFGGLALPAAAALFRWIGTPRRAAVFGGVCLVTAAGAVYEIAEWQIAVWLSPGQADAYNGQQGDVWDAQKDMALALAGTLLVALPWAVRKSP